FERGRCGLVHGRVLGVRESACAAEETLVHGAGGEGDERRSGAEHEARLPAAVPCLGSREGDGGVYRAAVQPGRRQALACPGTSGRVKSSRPDSVTTTSSSTRMPPHGTRLSMAFQSKDAESFEARKGASSIGMK